MTQSVATRMWVSAASDMSSPIGVSFRTSTLDGNRVLARDDGHRGSRQHYKCRTRMIAESAEGSISGYFSPAEIDFFLPKVLGNTGALRPENGVVPFWAVVEKANETYPATFARRFKYHNLYTNQLTISGQQSQYLLWNIDALGKYEETGVAAPSGDPACTACYAFSDIVFTYSGTAYPLKSFSFSINNFINRKTENNVRPTRWDATDCLISLSMVCEYRSDTEALYRASLDGAAASLLLGDIDVGSGTLNKYLFSFANLKIPNAGPRISAIGDLDMPLTMEAFRNVGSAIVPSADSDNAVFVTKTVT